MFKQIWPCECWGIPTASTVFAFSMLTGCYSGLGGFADTSDNENIGTDSAGGEGTPGDDSSGEPGDPDVPGVEADCISADQPRRLNRIELNRVAEDVFGITSEPFDILDSPGDAVGAKVGYQLGVSDAWVDTYIKAAEAMTAEYIMQHDFSEACGNAPSASCAEPVLTPLTKMMLRRPVEPERVDALIGVVQVALDNGLAFEEGLESAIVALFLTPEFLYVGTDVGSEPGVHELGGYEVATRLSLALWNSVPDEELLAAADNGELLNSEGIRAQVERMLADPDKGMRLIDTWASSYLDLSKLEDLAGTVPDDVDLSPEQWSQLLDDMKTEAVLTMKYSFENGLDVSEFVDAKYTFVNERLAQHYGIDGVSGEEFRRVEFGADSPLGGLLTMGASLLQNHGVIHRGVSVLESYMCTPIVAPSDAETLARIAEQLESAQSEEELVQLRQNDVACNGCHNAIDPLGIPFAQFNAEGQFQPQGPDGETINISSEFQGEVLTGPQSVRDLILSREFESCFAPNLLGPISNREMKLFNDADRCATEEIIETVEGSISLRSLIEATVVSGIFRTRVVAEPTGD